MVGKSEKFFRLGLTVGLMAALGACRASDNLPIPSKDDCRQAKDRGGILDSVGNFEFPAVKEGSCSVKIADTGFSETFIDISPVVVRIISHDYKEDSYVMLVEGKVPMAGLPFKFLTYDVTGDLSVNDDGKYVLWFSRMMHIAD